MITFTLSPYLLVIVLPLYLARMPAMHQRSLFSHLSWIYIALIALWLGLRALFFDQIWWLALLNSFAIYQFVPLPLLLLTGLWRRRWSLVGGLAIPTAIFFALFGTLILPKPSSAQVGDPAITVMTFNVLTSNKDTDALVHAIRAAQPITLPTAQPALYAKLRVHGQLVHVFVAHLTPNHLFKNPEISLATATADAFARRATEITFLHEQLHGINGPTLLLCDCNMTDTSQAHAELAAFLSDSFYEAGWGLRNTNDAGSVPLQRIDYVWHSAGLVAITAELGQAGGSDHLPVIVRLRLLQ
jgi:vancomycin resistance protein VanJ